MPARYDVFLSHASADKPLVEELALRLTREGLRPWLDKQKLIPGTSWLPELELALADCSACAVIIGPGGIGQWQQEEMRSAVRLRVEDSGRGYRVIPVLLPGVAKPQRGLLPGFLTATTWVEFRDSLDEPDAFRRLVCGILGIEPGVGAGGAAFEGRNPYRGLELFDVEHAPLFFGREAMTGRLLDALRRRPAANEARFLAIVGASGSGKSSLARAGLMAALRDGGLDGSASWPRAICRPGAEPFFSLANALKAVADESDRALVFDRLQGRKDGERSLHVAAGLALGEPPRAERLVLLVDQFEEAFTLCHDEAERRDFIANLLHAATAAGGRTVVILAMRADFYHRCASHADLAAALSSDRQVLVGPMTEDELRRAIAHPARLAGLEPEPGLVELLVDDIRDRAGALPLLQFALQEVWRRREDYRLTIRTYRAIGGIAGALQRKADAVYAGFTPEQQELCRRVLLRLVQPGEGSEDTRRRASLLELMPNDPAQAEKVRAIIDRLSDPETRLLTTEGRQSGPDGGTLEVAHEALIRGWPQLRRWIETDRAGLRTRLRITDGAKEWADAESGVKEGTLFAGARLAVASEWAAAHGAELGAVEAAYLSASQEHERQVKADEAERNRRLAEAERLRAEEAEAREWEARAATSRQKRLGRRFLVVAVAAVLLALAAAWQTDSARRATRMSKDEAAKSKLQASIATSRQLAALSVSERSRRLDRSLLLAVEAFRDFKSSEATGSLLSTFQDRPGLKSFLHIKEGNVSSVAFTQDGKILAAGYNNHVSGGTGLVLFDTIRRERIAPKPLAVRSGRVTSVAFSQDGKTLAASYIVGGRDSIGGVELFDLTHRERMSAEPLVISGGDIISVAFSQDGKTLAAGYSVKVGGRYGVGGGVVLFDAVRRERISTKPLAVREGGVNSVTFSQDNKTVAAAYSAVVGDSGGVVLFDAVRRERVAPEPLAVREGGVNSVAFSQDGKTLAAGYAGGVVLFDASRRERVAPEPLAVSEGRVTSVAFSQDNKTIAAGYSAVVGGSGGVVLFDATRRERMSTEPLAVREGSVTSVAFNQDGKTLAAGYSVDVVDGYGIDGGGVVLFDPDCRERIAPEPLAVREGDVTSVAFSQDGKILAAGYAGGVVLFDTIRRERVAPEPLAVREGGVNSVAFSQDGKTLAAGYAGGVVLFDAVRRERVAPEPLAVSEGRVTSVAFSQDGKILAAGYIAVDGGGTRIPFYSLAGSGGVVLFDASRRERVAPEPLAVWEGGVTSVAFSQDGKTLAAGYAGGVVLFDATRNERVAADPLAVREGGVTSVAFSHDGKILAAGYRGDVVGRHGVVAGVVLFDATLRDRIAPEPLAISEGRVTSVTFSHDGKILAAGYDFIAVGGGIGGGVVLFDAVRRERMSTEPLAVRGGGVKSVAFSRDDNILAAGYSGVVLLIETDLDSWKRIAGEIANRNLTWVEWRQFFPETPYRRTFDNLAYPPDLPPGQKARR